MDEAVNNAAITDNNVVDSSSVISEKLKATVVTSTTETVSSTTPAISLLNGETTNGIYKSERMEIDDTEDDSRISSENNGISQSSTDILKNVTVTDKLSKTKDQEEEEKAENCRITDKDEKKMENEESLVSTGLEDICSATNSPITEPMDTSEAKNTENEGECDDEKIENDDKECKNLGSSSSPINCGSNAKIITDTENCKQNGSKENQSAREDTVLENEISPDTIKNFDKDHVNEDDVSKESFSKKNGLVNENNKLLNNHQEKIQEIPSEEPTSQADSIGVDDVVNVGNASESTKDTKIDNVNDAESAKPDTAGNDVDSVTVTVTESDDDAESVHIKKTNDEDKVNSEEPMDVSDATSVCDAKKVEIEISLKINQTDKAPLQNRIEKPIEVNDELTDNQKQDVEQNVCTNEIDMKESKDMKETKDVNETTEVEEVKEAKEAKEKKGESEGVVNGVATEPEKKIIDKIHIIASDDEEEIEEPSSSTSAAVAVVSSRNDEKMDVDEETTSGKLKIDEDDECVIQESFVIGSDSETEMDTDIDTKRTNLSDPLGSGTGTLTVTSTTPNVESLTSSSLVSPVIPTTMASISLVSAPSSPTSQSITASSSCATITLPSATISKLIVTPTVTPISITPSIIPIAIATSTSTMQNNPIKSNLLVHDNKTLDYDDDDDCVVIEDDDDDIPTHKPLSNIRNFASIDHSIGDDSQPPAKKQKINNSSSNNSNITQIGQITIKDARTLMPQSLNETSFQQTFANNIKGKEAPGLVIIEAVSKNPQAIKQNSGILTDSIVTTTTSSKAGEINRNIYPVNMRSVIPTSTTASLSPPKLVPVSNSVVGLPMMSNADLLPGLTDDMFVLEAPSFIVPYIYEKPPSDNLREVISKIVPRYDLKKDSETTVIDSDTDEKVTGEDTPTSTVTGTMPILSSSSPSSSTTASTTATATSSLTATTTSAATSATTATAAATSTTEAITAEEGKGGIKKKSSYTGDESWAESDESDEEDEDSESETRTKVLIKEAIDDLSAIKDVMKPNVPVVNSMSGDKSDNYFDSPLGKFFLDIGVGLVQEFVQVDLLRLQKKKLRKSQKQSNAVKAELENAIQALGCNLETSRNKNVAFKFEKKRCEFCSFKSESLLSLANHYEAPHQNGVMYRCNFCSYEVRSSHDIIFHMEAMHNIQGRIEKSLSYNQCPLCPFEDNGKSRFARHIPTCVKKYRPEVNLAPPHDWEGPAKIPRIKPRHGLVGTATAYQAMAAQAAAQKAAIAALQLQQQQHARNLAPLTQNNTNAAKVVRRPQTGTNKASASLLRVNQPTTGVNRQTSNTTTTTTNMMLPNNYQISGGQLIQSTNAKKTTSTGQPSISITPLPRQPTTSATIKTQGGSLKPGQNIAGNKASFVICEICDGYIKDLEQLRTHMQWMHKVKIHPKMIYNRPPLNCQKCQFRFFTDQGLERHLLGSHGLVTSSMQEAANKGKDAGRCPVCGRMYQWKLLNHVSRDHHMTLKPAHLSYKCTVCTATFGMYKQFENHVYTAHSTVAKKAMDNKKNPNNSSSSNSNIGNNSHNTNNNRNLSASNDALLKPLKINDEITIIPQPASKMRNNNTSSLKMESHVID